MACRRSAVRTRYAPPYLMKGLASCFDVQSDSSSMDAKFADLTAESKNCIAFDSHLSVFCSSIKKMRALMFWSFTLLAIFAGTSALVGSSIGILEFSDSLNPARTSHPQQDRSALFGIGLIAITFTYRRAWLAWAGGKN